MHTILCPVDFTENTRNMLQYVLKMNAHLKARIILLHVYETPVLYTTAKFAMNQDLALFKEAKENLEDLRDTALKDSGSTQADTELIVEQGLPSEKIIEIALARNVNLLVMAASSLSKVERLVVGSNASRVINNAPCRIMIIPPSAAFTGLKKIVFATDLLADNLAAGKALEKFCKKFNAIITRVHVSGSTPEQASPDKPAVIRTKRSRAEKEGIHSVVADSVAQGIGKFMNGRDMNCLAVFHRPRNVFGNLANASLSKRLSFYCQTPVLILHANDRHL